MTAFEQHQQFMTMVREQITGKSEGERIYELECENADLRLRLERPVQLRADLETALEAAVKADEIATFNTSNLGYTSADLQLQMAVNRVLRIYRQIKEEAL